ncbi:MerR family transcriptional regulator [Clostridium sp. 'deep sea']|uniref:MerR family transcriptional regulator n=1 Tax=Clostridium sp. 'deep sea' TaxID=2779445 RepID=UPI00189675AF|nr:MerR family transcriptional regulator [Clostridium sp. 'deep sea']QOR34220.1 MerR family transcriptional regulator [Clostridium sp. 'deep sea']
MEYTVKKLSYLAGISSRTIRYYDEIDLLKPKRISSSGYRIYGEHEVNKLQQILFYRELGVSLDNIKSILHSPTFNEVSALKQHLHKLLAKQQQINSLIKNVQKTITMKEGSLKMTDKEKFEGFKSKLLAENEEKYGTEIREKYGEDAVDKSYKAFKNMNKAEYHKMDNLSKEINIKLLEAYKTGDVNSALAQTVAKLHKQWITMCWGYYNEEAHTGLVKMYVEDERFTAYYDKEQPGLAKFLRDSVLVYVNKA